MAAAVLHPDYVNANCLKPEIDDVRKPSQSRGSDFFLHNPEEFRGFSDSVKDSLKLLQEIFTQAGPLFSYHS